MKTKRRSFLKIFSSAILASAMQVCGLSKVSISLLDGIPQIEKYAVESWFPSLDKDLMPVELFSVEVEEGSISVPPLPVPSEGFEFVGWFRDHEICCDAPKYERVVKHRITLLARGPLGFDLNNGEDVNLFKSIEGIRRNAKEGYITGHYDPMDAQFVFTGSALQEARPEIPNLI